MRLHELRHLDAVLLGDLAHPPAVRTRAGDQIQLARDVARVERGDGDVVRLQVIGVVVPGVGEVRDHDLRAEPLDQLDQARRDHVVGLPVEGARVLVLRPAVHPRVAVAERLHVRHAERLGGHLQLAEPDARDVVGIVALLAGLDVAGRVAELAVRAGDEHRPDAFGRVAGEGDPGAVRLVVGVRVHRHQRQVGHRAQLARSGRGDPQRCAR